MIENEQTNVNEDNADYIETIQTMRENSVSREVYNKLKEDNKRLLNALSQGETITPEQKEPLDIPKTLQELENPDITPLDLWTKKIALRDYYLEKTGGKKDIFVGGGRDYIPAPDEKARAENVAKCIKHCIEYADGDNEAFIAEKDRITTNY